VVTQYAFFGHSLVFSGFQVLLVVNYSTMNFFPVFYPNFTALKNMKTPNYGQKVCGV
jgi:hypothetical protein